MIFLITVFGVMPFLAARDAFSMSTEKTSLQSTVNSKILVALGNNGNGGYLDDVEVIDLLSSTTTCQQFPYFPYKNQWAAGGLRFQDKPLICGGSENNPSTCHLYEDGSWKISDTLNMGRSSFAMTESPFQDGSQLFLTGGSLSSSEVLTPNGWQVSVPLAVPISDHCMVKVNSTTVMVIGGFQKFGYQSGNSFLFNSETNMWSSGPTTTSRGSHGCGMILKNSQTQEKALIVAGGFAFSPGIPNILSSVEVLDLDSNTWISGPELPMAITEGMMIEDPSGGVVLIGGSARDDITGILEPLDTLYHLSHAGSDATWELMPQKLTTARSAHVAFLIPDAITSCN